MFDSLSEFPYHYDNISKINGSFCCCYFWVNSTYYVI